jgi:hypothetical protein
MFTAGKDRQPLVDIAVHRVELPTTLLPLPGMPGSVPATFTGPDDGAPPVVVS